MVRRRVCTSIYSYVASRLSELLPNAHMVDLVFCDMVSGPTVGFVDVLVREETAVDDNAVECAEVCQ